MFSFVEIVAATDSTIGQLCWLAGTGLIEHVDWTWEWRDGGRAAFKFKDELQVMNFRARRFLWERFNAR